MTRWGLRLCYDGIGFVRVVLEYVMGLVMDERNWSKYEHKVDMDSSAVSHDFNPTHTDIMQLLHWILDQLTNARYNSNKNAHNTRVSKNMVDNSSWDPKWTLLMKSDFPKWFCLFCMIETARLLTGHYREIELKINKSPIWEPCST